MKPVIINTYKNKGGAAVAAGRITEAIKIEIPETTSIHLTDSKSGANQPGILKNLRPYIDFGVGFLNTFQHIPYFPAVLPTKYLNKKIKELNPDILHFHWMQGGSFDFSTKSIPEGIPLVWTFHDLWPITGGCAYPGNCKGYHHNCGNCPLFVFPHKKDLSYRSFQKKKEFFQSFSNIHIITPSSWLQKRVNESPLTRHINTTVIHNGLNTDLFRQIDKTEARKSLGVSDNKKIILFGAIGATKNPKKGFDLLLEAFKKMDQSSYRLIVFGATKKPKYKGLDISYYPIIQEHKTLNLLFSAADVMVVPSREEVFGQTVIEAMASGTPVAAFNNGGPADIINHKSNGFLAKPFDTDNLREGIEWIIENNPSEIGKKARNHIEFNFHIKKTASKYISLYQSLAQSEI